MCQLRPASMLAVLLTIATAHANDDALARAEAAAARAEAAANRSEAAAARVEDAIARLERILDALSAAAERPAPAPAP